MAGLLFSVCGRAQSAAAAAALDAALGQPVPRPPATRAGTLAVLAEQLREHATRLLLDWPGHLATVPRVADLRAVRGGAAGIESAAGDGSALAAAAAGEDLDARVSTLEARLAGVLLGNDALPLAALDDPATFDARVARGAGLVADLVNACRRQGLARLGTCDCPPMPALAPDALDTGLAGDAGEDFAARPDWQGVVFETGPLARLWSHPVIAALRREDGPGLLARVVARALELAALPARLRAVLAGDAGAVVERHAPRPGTGLAVLETVRGRLVHRAEVRDGRVSAYRILAPTEWNFHPRGPLARGLAGMPAADAGTATRLAALAAAALDPCVALDVCVERD